METAHLETCPFASHWEANGFRFCSDVEQNLIDALDTQAKHSLEKQDRFLKLFAQHGNVAQTAAGCGVGRSTIYAWERDDYLSFAKRWEQARHAYREAAEAQMDARLADPTGNRGSDILLMFKLKALWPDKYREAVVVVDDTAKRLLDRLGRGRARKDAGVGEEGREGEGMGHGLGEVA